jgi:hypothetical protein
VPAPGRKTGPYPGSSSRLRFRCCHERMIARRLHPVEPGLSANSTGQTLNGCCRTSWVTGVTSPAWTASPCPGWRRKQSCSYAEPGPPSPGLPRPAPPPSHRWPN